MVYETTGHWRILVISNALKISRLEDALSLSRIFCLMPSYRGSSFNSLTSTLIGLGKRDRMMQHRHLSLRLLLPPIPTLSLLFNLCAFRHDRAKLSDNGSLTPFAQGHLDRGWTDRRDRGEDRGAVPKAKGVAQSTTIEFN